MVASKTTRLSTWLDPRRTLLFAAALLLGSPALAQDEEGSDDSEQEDESTETSSPPPITTITRPLPPAPPVEEELPIPTLTIDRIPPRTSFEFALQISYGQVAYFTESVPAWLGFGMRGGWGRNLGQHRLGVAGTFTAEGDFGVHTLLALEPSVTWDYVNNQGLLLGLGAGPALMYTSTNSTIEGETAFQVDPSVAARIGWSQTWSRVGRRLFVFLEPKVRITQEGVTPLVAIAVGSGGGR